MGPLKKAGPRDVDLCDIIHPGLKPDLSPDIVLFSGAGLRWVFCGLQSRGSLIYTCPFSVSSSTDWDSVFFSPPTGVIVAYFEFQKK